jgi:hypothetical protein
LKGCFSRAEEKYFRNQRRNFGASPFSCTKSRKREKKEYLTK